MIYDCFRFYNEFDLLEIRLNELRDVADRHVIVESDHNWTGTAKPYFLDGGLKEERFAEFVSKIIRVKVKSKHGTNAVMNDWAESDAILEGLSDASRDDWVIAADCDEIPRASSIKSLGALTDPMTLWMPMYYYYVNVLMMESWSYPKIARCGDVFAILPRHLRCLPDLPGPRNSGWHFGWTGGVKEIELKLKATSHTEYAIPDIMDPVKIAKRLQYLVDPMDRWFELKPIPFDDSFPQYLIQNRERFKHLIYEYGNPYQNL